MCTFHKFEFETEKIMEVSKDSLKVLRDEVGMHENFSNKNLNMRTNKNMSMSL